MNVWWTGPVVLAILPVPSGKTGLGQTTQEQLDLLRRQASHADIHGSRIGNAVDRSIGIVNVACSRE